MKIKFTVTLDDQTFSIVEIRNIQFQLIERSKVTLDIKTASKGTFHYETDLSEKEKVRALVALRDDLISTLRVIAENNLSVE